jgi:putative ABC transport system permease protein
VFDPPPDTLAVPWAFLGVVGAAAICGTVLAAAVAVHAIHRLPLAAILREP